MQYSIKEIGKFYEEFSKKINEDNLFSSFDFFNFAKLNANKYGIIEHGDDLLIDSFGANSLIKDYKFSKLIGTCDIINNIPQQPQVQYDLKRQLTELRLAANKLGLYDAADFLLK